MKCVILAAGISKRLRPLTATTPKCLLKIGSKTLLQRLVENAMKAGCTDFCVVTGFKATKIRQFLSTRFPKRSFLEIQNERFSSTNNMYSLSLAKEFVGGSSFLLLDCDIVFGGDLLPYFNGFERYYNRLAVRVRGPHDEEEIKVKINRWDQILRIGKDVPLRETYGESIGIGLFSSTAVLKLFRIIEERIKAGPGKREFYEAAFQQLIDLGTRLWAVDVSDFPSAEIDTHEDLERARQKILPGIEHA